MRVRRATLFAIHGWIGVKLLILLGVVFVTGTLATVSHEIDWLLNPAIRVTPQPGPVRWSAIIESVERAYPEASIEVVAGPRHSWHAADVLVDTGARDRVHVYVDPYSGRVTGTGPWMNVQRFLRNAHMMLFIPRIGFYVVSFFGFVLAVSLITGLVVNRKFWRGLFRSPRWGTRPRVFWADVHKLTGVWSVWFIAIIAATGIWYFVEMAMFDGGVGLADTPAPPPTIAEAALDRLGPRPPKYLPLDELVARAEVAYPGFKAREIYWPHDKTAAIDITGDAAVALVRARANRVFLDPYTGEVLSVQRGDGLPLGYRWVHTADPLHFGDFGGLFTQCVWFVFGALLSTMAFTGAWIWYRRLLDKLGRARRLSAARGAGDLVAAPRR
jgi:uncharacterized iron-regulated membrane protein